MSTHSNEAEEATPHETGTSVDVPDIAIEAENQLITAPGSIETTHSSLGGEGTLQVARTSTEVTEVIEAESQLITTPGSIESTHSSLADKSILQETQTSTGVPEVIEAENQLI